MSIPATNPSASNIHKIARTSSTFQTGISCLGNENEADFQDANKTPRSIRFRGSSFLCSLLAAPPQAINDMATRTHESIVAIAFLPRRNHTINCQPDVKTWANNAQHRKQQTGTRHREFRRWMAPTQPLPINPRHQLSSDHSYYLLTQFESEPRCLTRN
jgi:hypothetical protein